jgi:hypothetical protein
MSCSIKRPSPASDSTWWRSSCVSVSHASSSQSNDGRRADLDEAAVVERHVAPEPLAGAQEVSRARVEVLAEPPHVDVALLRHGLLDHVHALQVRMNASGISSTISSTIALKAAKVMRGRRRVRHVRPRAARRGARAPPRAARSSVRSRRSGRERDVALLDRPAVGALLDALARLLGEPVVGAPHRVLAGDDEALVVAHRHLGPAQPPGLLREVDVEERQVGVREEELDHLLEVRLVDAVVDVALARWAR